MPSGTPDSGGPTQPNRGPGAGKGGAPRGGSPRPKQGASGGGKPDSLAAKAQQKLTDKLQAAAQATVQFTAQVASWVGAVGKNTAALLSRGKPGEGAKGGAAKAGKDPAAIMQKAMMGFVGILRVLLAPVMGLNHLLSQVTSGFDLFMKAVKYVSMILASVFMPVFVVLGAAMLTLGDRIARVMIPAVMKFSKVLGRLFGGKGKGGAGAGPGGKKQPPGTGTDFRGNSIEYPDSMGKYPSEYKPGEKRADVYDPDQGKYVPYQPQKLAAMVPKPTPALLPGFPGSPDGERLNKANAAKAAQGATTKGPEPGSFEENLDLMLQEVARINSPQTKLGGIADAWKEALKAGIEGSPLDRKLGGYITQLKNAVIQGFREARSMA